MREFSIGLLIFLIVLFAGGYFNVKGAPILDRVDSLFNTTMLMDLHHGVFFFVYRGTDRVEQGVTGANRKVHDFQERPVGIDNKKHYRKLNDAANY